MSTIRALPDTRDFFTWVYKDWSGRIGLAFGLVYVLVGVTSSQQLVDVKAMPLDKLFTPLLVQNLPSLLEVVALFPLVIACAMLRLPPWLSVKQQENKAAVDSCNQFRLALVLLISMWALFYLAVFAYGMHVKGDNASQSATNLQPLMDGLNNLQGVFLFACYWILTTKTAAPGSEAKSEVPLNKGPVPLWALYLFLLWGFLVFWILDFFLSNTVLGSFPTRQLFQLLSGLWVGAALALLVGCMESPFLSQPRALTISLYFYAALQVAYVEFFPSDPKASGILQALATVTSLPLKLLLIGFWAWTFENGLLAFYMRRTRTDLDEAVRLWSAFSAGADHGTPRQPREALLPEGGAV